MRTVRTSRKGRRLAAGALAAMVWIGLGLQLGIVVQNAITHGTSVASGIVTYLAYFTILTNLLVAMVLTDAMLKARRGELMADPGAMTAIAAYLCVVGLVYVTLLRQLWHPVGPQYIADIILHYISPILYLIYWAIYVEKGTVNWSDCLTWLGYPILYMCYILIRGRLSGSYPYPFINVTVNGYGGVLIHAAVFVLLFIAWGLALTAVDRAMGRPERMP